MRNSSNMSNMNVNVNMGGNPNPNSQVVTGAPSSQGGQQGQNQPGAQNNVQATGQKVFVQRDFSLGTGVRFQTRFPQELEGRVSITVSLCFIGDVVI